MSQPDKTRMSPTTRVQFTKMGCYMQYRSHYRCRERSRSSRIIQVSQSHDTLYNAVYCMIEGMHTETIHTEMPRCLTLKIWIYGREFRVKIDSPVCEHLAIRPDGGADIDQIECSSPRTQFAG
jgi:hypothetical protein